MQIEQTIETQTYSTNKDKNILDALNIYGRSGVPLYVYWKPGMEKPYILPAILTEKIVLDALKN